VSLRARRPGDTCLPGFRLVFLLSARHEKFVLPFILIEKVDISYVTHSFPLYWRSESLSHHTVHLLFIAGGNHCHIILYISSFFVKSYHTFLRYFRGESLAYHTVTFYVIGGENHCHIIYHASLRYSTWKFLLNVLYRFY
jgi:hypothetical protein